MLAVTMDKKMSWEIKTTDTVFGLDLNFSPSKR